MRIALLHCEIVIGHGICGVIRVAGLGDVVHVNVPDSVRTAGNRTRVFRRATRIGRRRKCAWRAAVWPFDGE